jgi:TonB family protein
MNKSRLIFFFAVLAVVFGIARCNSSKTALTQAPKPTPSPSASPALSNSSLLIPPPAASPITTTATTPVLAQSGATPPELRKTADRIASAIVALSVFDGPGRLLRTGTGFFISPDGKLATSRSVINEGAHAVAKTTDGKIYNITGVLSQDTGKDVAILKTEVKEVVPFVATEKSASLDPSKRVAIVSSPVDRRADNVAISALGTHHSNTTGEWNDLSATVGADSLGAPVITEDGEILGIVTLERGEGSALTVVRAANALVPLLSHIDKRTKAAWAVVSPDGVLSPGEGPPPKPKATPPPVIYPPGTRKLVYAPRPRYPNEARRAPFIQRGTGRYRISFGRDGAVHSVQIVESTHNQALDSAAMQTLRTWKAAPGTDWTAEVPLTFSP